MSLSTRQLHLIKQAKALGYGYQIFALNVEKQGWCSAKQEAALDRMVAAGTYRKNNWTERTRKWSRSGYHYTGRYASSVVAAMDWDDYYEDGFGAYESFW